MTRTVPRASRTSTWWLLFLAAVLCVFPVLVMAGSQYIDRGDNVVGSCFYVPAPDDVASIDNALRQASLTAVPAGIRCEWDRAGGGTVSVQTGWPTTVAGMAGSVLLVVFTAAALRWPGAGRRFVTVIPLALGTALWIVVFLSAHTVAA